jgi:hypothetical protein
MTEDDWLTCASTVPMLRFLGSKASERKLRLFACACCRRLWPLLPHPANRAFVETAESLADAAADDGEPSAAPHDAHERHIPWDELCAVLYAGGEADPGWLLLKALTYSFKAEPNRKVVDRAQAVSLLAALKSATYSAAFQATNDPGKEAELKAQAELLRDIFNPFRPVPALDPAWLAWYGGSVPRLARLIYDERRWQDLPVLAEALEEAGCANANILSHCTQPREHVRGCWVVDLLRGKA